MHVRPYGAPRPAQCEELKVRTLHRGQRLRLNNDYISTENFDSYGVNKNRKYMTCVNYVGTVDGQARSDG